MYLYLYLTNIIQISYLLHISIISGAATQNHNMGTRTKWTLYFRCVGIPTHIKHQNNNNNIKTITLHMSPPPKIWGKPFSFQGYFHFYCKMSRLKSTTLKPIYGFWANGGESFTSAETCMCSNCDVVRPVLHFLLIYQN